MIVIEITNGSIIILEHVEKHYLKIILIIESLKFYYKQFRFRLYNDITINSMIIIIILSRGKNG